MAETSNNEVREAINKTKQFIVVEAVAIAREQNQTDGEKKDYFITIAQLHDIVRDACSAHCGLTEEYGFVAEAGCPIHD